MDKQDDGLSKDTSEEICKQYSEGLSKYSPDAEFTSISQEYLQLSKNLVENPRSKCQCRQNDYVRPPEPRNAEKELNTQTASCCTYKYKQNFGRTIVAFPVTLDWVPKNEEGDDCSTDHSKDTEKSIISENSNNNNPVLLDSSHSMSINITDRKHIVQTPSESEPKFPLPTCPPPSCDAYNIKFECGIKDSVFKLKCKESADREHPNSISYECKLVDEGQCLDMLIAMAATDLKCKHVEGIHGLHSIVMKKVAEDAQDSIIATEAVNEKEGKNQPNNDDVLEE